MPSSIASYGLGMALIERSASAIAALGRGVSRYRGWNRADLAWLRSSALRTRCSLLSGWFGRTQRSSVRPTCTFGQSRCSCDRRLKIGCGVVPPATNMLATPREAMLLSSNSAILSAALLAQLWRSGQSVQRTWVPCGGFSSIILMPSPTIALDQRDGGAWPPRAGCIRLRRHIQLLPGLEDGIRPTPRRLDLVHPHKQGRPATDHIQ